MVLCQGVFVWYINSGVRDWVRGCKGNGFMTIFRTNFDTILQWQNKMYVKRTKRNFWACSDDKESKLPPLGTGWPWEAQGRSLQIKPTWKGVLSAWGCRFLSLSCCLCFGRFLRWRNSSVSFPEPSTESYNQVWWTAWRALKCLWQQLLDVEKTQTSAGLPW